MADDKPKTEITKSAAQLENERLTDKDYVDGTALTSPTLNPNPFGEGSYVGVDPIYQNYATDNEKPLEAKSGAEKKLEQVNKDLYKVEDESTLVNDPGFGGKSTLAGSKTVEPSAFLVPGQEGYVAPEGGGVAVRKDAADAAAKQQEATREAAEAENAAQGTQTPTPASVPTGSPVPPPAS